MRGQKIVDPVYESRELRRFASFRKKRFSVASQKQDACGFGGFIGIFPAPCAFGIGSAGCLLHGGAQQPRIERFAFGKGWKKKCGGVENETGFAGFLGSIKGCRERVRGRHGRVFHKKARGNARA